ASRSGAKYPDYLAHSVPNGRLLRGRRLPARFR
ncbi:MAG: hypothetical protein, partial [Olavius algarvensis Gamma 1 endosymbiont]